LSNTDFKEMVEFFKTHELDSKPFNLNKSTVVVNKKKFADSHLEILLANSGKKSFTPFYLRLKALYDHERK